MNSFRFLVGLLALMLVGLIFGAAMYEAVVLAPNFRHDIPHSLEHFRQFMSVANPGTFFRAVAPPAQLAVLVSLILCWKIRGARGWFIVGLAAIVGADVVTFTFHYPRNHFLFHSPLTQPVAELTAAAEEWGNGNLVRVALVAVSMIAVALALKKAVSVSASAPAGH